MLNMQIPQLFGMIPQYKDRESWIIPKSCVLLKSSIHFSESEEKVSFYSPYSNRKHLYSLLTQQRNIGFVI